MWGAFYGVRAAANQMIRQGRGGSIVVVSSPHAIEAVPTSMAYNMAKAAVDQMARTAAVELVPHRIRVNIVHPGWTDTPGERKYFSEEVLERAAKATSRRQDVSIEAVYCLGLRASGPAGLIDGQPFARLDSTRLDTLIEALEP